jgi:hypothetical protein
MGAERVLEEKVEELAARAIPLEALGAALQACDDAAGALCQI